MSANSYKKDIIAPFINKLKTVIKRIIHDYLRLKHEVKDLRSKIFPLKIKINEQEEIINRLIEENHIYSVKLRKLQKHLGHKAYDEILNKTKEKKKNVRENNYR